MPAPKKTGRKRLEIVAEPEWIDLVTEAAKKADRSLSSYIRVAVNARLAEDGFASIQNREPVKPRGRPRKEK
jgi:hypothetical protein